jgi:transketolase
VGCKEAGQAKEAAWNEKFAAYAKAFPQEAAEFTRRAKGDMPSDFDAKANEFIAKLQANPSKIASRKASQNAIEAFGLGFQNSWAAPLTWRHLT